MRRRDRSPSRLPLADLGELQAAELGFRLGAFFPTPGYCDEEMNVYLASQLRQPREGDEAAHQDEDEDIETKSFSREALRQMIASGELIDLKTIAGLSLLSSE